ncbi:DNA mismatch repair protein MutT [Hymenobacter qilianensis]|uniref:DNA mismatch repair protein MutT n=2 Tax=Hymenobacter qilianensis TaxID=1385715 RepID=A0ACB5PV61_9BACT|nr:(deoxy)nucleoside triphosphate pyrophosphohydrolase [Hymenobacter qilianensis]QNP51455.1 (deoxy)nucleoside triphosphate pyrophosphohydrolase [Hymenobacter qilianensis]GGF75001.1 DNA mismatch repair protein MutT [Hymenobacter qilianensis]
MKHHEVVAAIIQRGDEFLCLQRGPSKYDYIAHKWEFPGGKVEAGETQQAALVREIQEELGLGIQVGSLLLTVEHDYPDFRITMHGLLCTALTAELTLHEHVAYRWLRREQLDSLDWAAADLPLVAKLQA